MSEHPFTFVLNSKFTRNFLECLRSQLVNIEKIHISNSLSGILPLRSANEKPIMMHPHSDIHGFIISIGIRRRPCRSQSSDHPRDIVVTLTYKRNFWKGISNCLIKIVKMVRHIYYIYKIHRVNERSISLMGKVKLIQLKEWR